MFVPADHESHAGSTSNAWHRSLLRRKPRRRDWFGVHLFCFSILIEFFQNSHHSTFALRCHCPGIREEAACEHEPKPNLWTCEPKPIPKSCCWLCCWSNLFFFSRPPYTISGRAENVVWAKRAAKALNFFVDPSTDLPHLLRPTRVEGS